VNGGWNYIGMRDGMEREEQGLYGPRIAHNGGASRG
jgi:hypothetical protein